MKPDELIASIVNTRLNTVAERIENLGLASPGCSYSYASVAVFPSLSLGVEIK